MQSILSKILVEIIFFLNTHFLTKNESIIPFLDGYGML
jgi:hypothetical protein